MPFPESHLREVLQARFGFENFRPGQEHQIQTLLREGRVLCIQPTGYGKSLLYQLSAVLLEGVTLVISPLLALMRDQMSHLEQRFKIPAASINSDQTEEENAAAMRRAEAGQVKILFIAPERLDHLIVYEFLLALPVGLLVIDEAHCISTWGHDFRPSYRQIINAVRDFEKKRPGLRILALTATANSRTEADIAAQLRSPDGAPLAILRSGMDRPNLSLASMRVQGIGEKLAFLDQRLRNFKGCGLLYCATREQTEIVAQYLARRGHKIDAYHAGFDSESKRALQHKFVNGETRLISATNALGMGIDKSDIRLIVHVDLPGSITAYYQEVGRAGRDGQPAQGLLLFDEADRKVQDYFIHSAQPQPSDFRAILAAMQPSGKGKFPTLTEIKTSTGLHPTRITVVMAELIEQGHVIKQKDGSSQVYRPTGSQQEIDLGRYVLQNQVRSSELDTMIRYGKAEPACLMAHLRNALGDDSATSCGRCSRCKPEAWEAQLQIPDATDAWHWLAHREVPILATTFPKMAEGQAVLNAESGSPFFANFMRNRADRPSFTAPTELQPELLQLVLEKLDLLVWNHKFALVLVMPSRSWKQRESLSRAIEEKLKVPVREDLLYWSPWPEARQGQLHNNDQRKANVAQRLRLGEALELGRQGDILLVDDYTGSGATLKEAGRLLTKGAGFKGKIVPFVIAKVRWRLGAAGMVG